MFVDNFLFSILVPATQVVNKHFQEVGTMNTHIRLVLRQNGLVKSSVKAIGIELCKNPLPTDEQKRDSAYCNDNTNTKYYWQNYKISCSDENMENVMCFLREKKYR